MSDKMNVRERNYKELAEIQKVNEARRHDYFVQKVHELSQYYRNDDQNFANKNKNLIEFLRPFFPPVDFQELINEGVLNE